MIPRFSRRDMGHSLVQRILTRLEDAENHEVNPHLQDDYRISWITVLRASRGERIPHVSATYEVLGLHPDKVWPAILARRKALLGPLYEAFYGVSLPPKKPVESVGVPLTKRARAPPERSGDLKETARNHQFRAACTALLTLRDGINSRSISQFGRLYQWKTR